MKTPFRSIFFILILSIFSCNNTNIFSPPLNKAIDYFYLENKNDSVFFYLKELQTSNKQEKIIGEIVKAGALCEIGKIDSAYSVINDIKIESKNEELNCWYKSIKGLIFFRQEKLTESYQSLISTLSYKGIDKRTLALNERIIARILFSMSENKQAIEYLLLSNKHFQEVHLSKSVAVNQKILGRFYMQTKNFAQAIKCFESAENVFRKYNDEEELFYIYINFIDYYINTNNYEKATYFTQKCEIKCQTKHDFQMKSILNNNMGELAIKQKKYAEAIRYYNSTLELPNGFPYEHIRKLNANINLSQVYNILNDKVKSQFHAQQAKKLHKPDNETITQYKLYRRLAESFIPNQSQSQSLSYNYLDTATLWLDSAYRSATQTSKAFYDSKADLMAAAFKIQQMEQRANRTKTIYLFLAVLITISAVSFTIIYRLQKIKNRALQQLVNKNLHIIEEERRLRALHTLQGETNKKVNRKTSDTDKTELLYNLFIEWLEKNKTYCRRDLTLEIVSKELNTNRDYLSRSINEKNIRFTDLINKYRIEEAIHIISDTQNIKSRYNLSVIASEVGFNSVSVFIDAFKKQTGMTPNQFRENLKSAVKY